MRNWLLPMLVSLLVIMGAALAPSWSPAQPKGDAVAELAAKHAPQAYETTALLDVQLPPGKHLLQVSVAANGLVQDAKVVVPLKVTMD